MRVGARGPTYAARHQNGTSLPYVCDGNHGLRGDTTSSAASKYATCQSIEQGNLSVTHIQQTIGCAVAP